MAFKEKSEKALLAMSKEEQIAYWQEFQAYYKEQKKKIQKKQNERAAAEKQKNRKKTNHARFVLFGELIKHDEIKTFIKKMSEQNSFSEKDKADINLLMNDLNWEIKF
jgi:hypothetical protein